MTGGIIQPHAFVDLTIPKPEEPGIVAPGGFCIPADALQLGWITDPPDPPEAFVVTSDPLPRFAEDDAIRDAINTLQSQMPPLSMAEGPVSVVMEETEPGDWDRNVITIRAEAPFSRAFLIEGGYIEPTEEERARAAHELEEAAERKRRWHARKVEAWRLYDAALETFGRLTDPTIRAVLDHHAPKVGEYERSRTRCEGCDAEGYEWEYPSWPCSTVALIGKVQGIALPASEDLDLDYDHDTKTYRRPE